VQWHWLGGGRGVGLLGAPVQCVPVLIAAVEWSASVAGVDIHLVQRLALAHPAQHLQLAVGQLSVGCEGWCRVRFVRVVPLPRFLLPAGRGGWIVQQGNGIDRAAWRACDRIVRGSGPVCLMAAAEWSASVAGMDSYLVQRFAGR
jgi:hypothetical protein